jgi:hypothetical protein
MKDYFEELKNRPKPNLFKRIRLWWKFDGQYLHKTIINGFENLIYWFPIIWKDRNWDSNFIFEILKHKLAAQSKYIKKYNRHTAAELDARRMNICIKLIQKLQDDYYELEYMDYAKNKHWFEACNDGTTNLRWKTENIWEKYDDYFKKYPLIYKRVMNGEGFTSLVGREGDKQVIAMSIAHLNHDRARILLFKILNENIERWWN